jgi:hypothetical protein
MTSLYVVATMYRRNLEVLYTSLSQNKAREFFKTLRRTRRDGYDEDQLNTIGNYLMKVALDTPIEEGLINEEYIAKVE